MVALLLFEPPLLVLAEQDVDSELKERIEENLTEESGDELDENVSEEKDDIWCLAGFPYGSNELCAIDKENVLTEYSAKIECLKQVIEAGNTEYQFDSPSLSVSEVKDIILYLLQETDTTQCHLLPRVGYTYIEEENNDGVMEQLVQSVQFFYLNPEEMLTLKQSYRSLKKGVELEFSLDDVAEIYRIYRSDVDGEEKKLLAELSELETGSYIDAEISDTAEYEYHVVAFRMEGEKEVVCNYSTLLKSTYTLGAPENLNVEEEKDYIALTWDNAENADGYEIEVYDPEAECYRLLGTVSTTEYKHTDISPGSFYTYRIRSFEQGTEQNMTVYSEYSEEMIGYTSLEMTDVANESISSDEISLQWEPVQGADGYYIYQNNEQVADIAENCYTAAELELGTEYRFGVSAYYRAGDSVIESDVQESYAMPVLSVFTPAIELTEDMKLKLFWEGLTYSCAYEIYRKTADQEYELIQIMTSDEGNSFTDPDVEIGTTYIYQIRPIKMVEDRIYYGEFSSEISGVVNLNQPVIDQVSKVERFSLSISWSEVKGAAGYEVYRSDTIAGEYVFISDLPSDILRYQDSGLVLGKEYHYQIRAYANTSNGKVYGSFSTVKSGHAQMSDVTGLAVTMTKCNTLELTWNANADAASYEVYYSTQPDSGYKRLTSTKKTNYRFTKAKCGVTYYFKVYTYRKVGKIKYYGDDCQAVSGKTVLTGVPQAYISKTSYDSITLKWPKVKDAPKYEIYYAESPGGEYRLLKSQSGTSYIHKKLSTGVNYYYKVRAVRDSFYTEYSDLIEGRPVLGTLSGLKVSAGKNQLKVSWKKVTGAKSYVISRSESLNGEYKEITRTSKISYTDKGLTSGTTYYYKVYALRDQYQTNTAGPIGQTTKGVKPLPPNQYYGVDVSSYQGKIDWKSVKKEGIDFAMLRIVTGNSFSTAKDGRFEENYKNATGNGIKVGVYRYSYATSRTKAREEARNVLAALNGRKLDYPIVMDVEDISILEGTSGNERRSEIILAFKEVIEDAGYQFALYANLNWLNNYLDMNMLKDVDIWIARWRDFEKGHGYSGKGNVIMWQYTNEGRIKGITGRVDRNLSYNR